MQIKFNRVCNNLLTEVKLFIKNRRSNLLVLLAVIVAGLVLGIILTSARDDIDGNSINYIVLITKGEYNIVGTCIKIILLTILGHALICCSCFHKFLCVSPYITLFYAAYRFGVRLVSIVVIDKFSGVICLITYIIPLYLVILGSYLVLACMMRNLIIEGGYYHRCNCCYGRVVKLICRKALFLNCWCMPLVIIVTIFIPCIASFIIVV